MRISDWSSDVCSSDLRFELRRHRRPGIGVGTGDRMTGFARDRRNAGHEGAADAEDMDAHVAAQPPAPNSMPAHEPANATKNSKPTAITSAINNPRPHDTLAAGGKIHPGTPKPPTFRAVRMKALPGRTFP